LLSLGFACIWLRLAYGRRLAFDFPKAVAAVPAWELAVAAGLYLGLIASSRWRIVISGPEQKVTWGLYLWDLPLRVRALRFGDVQTLRLQRRYSFLHGTCYSVDMAFWARNSRTVMTLLRVSNTVEALYLARELGKLIGCPTV
jgi:hypothetical protein